jgi:hypothetical protein
VSRHTLDQYFTETSLALAICQRVAATWPDIALSKSSGTGPTILEPSAGRGAFVDAARAVWSGCWVDAVELDPVLAQTYLQDKAHGVLVKDFLTHERPPFAPTAANQDAGLKVRGYDLIIGNPPYVSAHEHIAHAVSLLAPGGLAVFLLRIELVATRRFDRRQLVALTPVMPRPRFIDSGSDMCEYALYTFAASAAVARLEEPLVWREKAARRKRGLIARILDTPAVEVEEDF